MEEYGPSILLSIRSYLTPTGLFFFLNLVIATIFFTSRNIRRHHQDQEDAPPHNKRPTALERVRSIGLFRSGSRDLPPPQHQDPHPTALERLKSIGLFRFGSGDLPRDEPPLQDQTPPAGHYDDMDHHFRRIQSENAVSRPKPAMAAAAEGGSTLRKLASALSWRSSEVTTVRRRPASRREEEADEEVDARADDFINRFKQQLRLQRLDSIMRGTRR